MNEDIVSIAQAIDELGICRATLYNRINALGIQTIKQNHKTYIASDDLYQLADKISIIQELKQEKIKNQQLQGLLKKAEDRAKSYQQEVKSLSEQKEASKQKGLWSFLSKK